MSLGDRVAAWLAAWKWVLILLLALALSLWLNVWQYQRGVTAPYRAAIASKDQALANSAALLDRTGKTVRRLEEAAGKAASRLSGAARDYDAAAAAKPLSDPSCAPGQGRIDAVNRAAGAED